MSLSLSARNRMERALCDTGAANEVCNAIDGVVASAADALTAFATGGQTSATQLSKELNRVTTVATAGDSVKLPPSTPGAWVLLQNSGANSMQVFGAGTDTINDVAAATGVAQMAASLVLYGCTVAGKWFAQGLGTGYSGSLETFSFATGLTAHAGGTQAAALPLAASYNKVTTVATQGDSVLLPASAPGMEVTLDNRGANAMQVFGAGTDTINGIATATGLSHGVNQIASYYCTVAGNWTVQFAVPQQSGYVLLSADGAIPAHVGHDYMITKTGSLASLTLAAPTAGVDDGLTITVSSDTAFAHKITCPASTFKNGGAAVTIFTFTGTTSGGGLTLKAYNGTWKVMSSAGGAFS